MGEQRDEWSLLDHSILLCLFPLVLFLVHL
jgi:hypothetical protein